jgi:hypothetical protein
MFYFLLALAILPRLSAAKLDANFKDASELATIAVFFYGVFWIGLHLAAR